MKFVTCDLYKDDKNIYQLNATSLNDLVLKDELNVWMVQFYTETDCS